MSGCVLLVLYTMSRPGTILFLLSGHAGRVPARTVARDTVHALVT